MILVFLLTAVTGFAGALPPECGTPAIDGIDAPGEWDGATSWPLWVTLPGGGDQVPATVYALNDTTHYYFAVRIDDTRFYSSVGATFIIDSDFSGWGSHGDEIIAANYNGWLDETRPRDLYMYEGGACPEGVVCSNDDWRDDGTTDSLAQSALNKGFRFVELSMPRQTADPHDAPIPAGGTIRFRATISLSRGPEIAHTDYPRIPQVHVDRPMTCDFGGEQ